MQWLALGVFYLTHKCLTTADEKTERLTICPESHSKYVAEAGPRLPDSFFSALFIWTISEQVLWGREIAPLPRTPWDIKLDYRAFLPPKP